MWNTRKEIEAIQCLILPGVILKPSRNSTTLQLLTVFSDCLMSKFKMTWFCKHTC